MCLTNIGCRWSGAACLPFSGTFMLIRTWSWQISTASGQVQRVSLLFNPRPKKKTEWPTRQESVAHDACLSASPCLAFAGLALSCAASSCLVLSCLVLLRLVAFLWRLVLSCLALACLALPCVFLPCLVLSYFFCFEVQANCDWLVLPRFMLPLFS